MYRLLIIALLSLTACSRHRPDPVPRPEALPRVSVLAPSYSPAGLGGDLTAMVHDSALVTHPRPDWTNLAYPAYAATVNCTYTRVDASTLASTLDNRMERLTLNAGDAAGEMLSMELPRGGGALLMVMRGRCVTPVQFIATDSASWVLSGSAVMEAAATRPELVRPRVDALAADLTKLLHTLTHASSHP